MNSFSRKKCTPCTAATPPLKGEALNKYTSKLQGWKCVEEAMLEKEFLFKNFREALEFTNTLGKMAEEEGHHPDIFLSWGKVIVFLSTHKIKGLSENDFILASKCDEAFAKRGKK
jgi:4a-hydroxytetrahydrobiopterin dehydratase